ncbi:MAG: hypothetical protein ACPGPF_06225, partial [Pontibacterium sp.]
NMDSEFYLAVEKATELGPWEEAVLLTITQAGLYAWPSLNDLGRARVVANIHRGNRFYGAKNKALLKHLGLQKEVCAYLWLDKQNSHVCDVKHTAPTNQ